MPLDFGDIEIMTGVAQLGVHDVACPECGPDRRSPSNRRRKVLRIWRAEPDFASYHCARCGTQGYARADGGQRINPQQRSQLKAEAARRNAERDRSQRDKARWLWRLYTNRSEGLGKVSQRWLAVHRTENL